MRTPFRLEGSVFGAGIETWTGLADPGEVAVTEDDGIGVVDLQTGQHGMHGSFLCRGSGVGRASFFVKATLVADSDAVGVVVAGMGTNGLLTPTGMDPAITGDV